MLGLCGLDTIDNFETLAGFLKMFSLTVNSNDHFYPQINSTSLRCMTDFNLDLPTWKASVEPLGLITALLTYFYLQLNIPEFPSETATYFQSTKNISFILTTTFNQRGILALPFQIPLHAINTIYRRFKLGKKNAFSSRAK